MPNLDAPSGFKPYRMNANSPYSGGVNRYWVPATETNNLFIGDPVDLSGTGDTAGTSPTVVRATAGSGGVVGVIVGIENLTDSNLSRTHLPGSTGGYVLVADDPDEVFEIQEDSDGGALAITDIGLNATFIIGSGNTTTGLSATELDSSTKETTATLHCRILRLLPREDNEIGNQAKWLVRFNTHRHNNATGA